MKKHFKLSRLFLVMTTMGTICLNTQAMGAAYQLFEQDAASIGNYHAGRAAIADDASTAYYNPAGLIRIKNQELVVGADPIVTDVRFNGTVAVNTVFDPVTGDINVPRPVQGQGGGFNLIPFLHYAAPINDCVVFGLSVDVPYGLKTDWGTKNLIRYAAILSSVNVVDISPSLGFALGDKFSFGFGADVQRMNGKFTQMATAVDETNDTFSSNNGSSTAYGYHLGALYQFTPQTRIGISYHSKVVHHLKGTSKFSGPLANDSLGGNQISNSLHLTTTLPPTTSLSLFHSMNCWDFMGTVTYTQWRVFQSLILKNTAGRVDGVSVNDLPIIIQEHYSNSWNYAVGANFHPNDQWILRSGLGFDQTPSHNAYRNIELPDSDRIAVALGAHYQWTKCLGFDLGYAHIFAVNTRINNIAQTVGDETVTSNGSIKSSADVYGLGMKWDIA